MSDADLRELVRRWRETGSVEDEAACLNARLRAGVITPERAELARWIRDEPFPELVWVGGERSGEVVLDVGLWSIGITRHEKEASLRVCAALLREVAQRIDQAQVDSEALEAVSEVLCLLEESCLEASVGVAVKPRMRRRLTDLDADTVDPLVRSALLATRFACDVARCASSGEPGQHPNHSIATVRTVETLQEVLGGPDLVRGVIGEDLLPWALGNGDPLRDRVEARQRAEAASE